MDLHAQLTAQIQRLHQEGGDGNRLLVASPEGWVQLLGGRGEQALTVEVSAGKHLPAGARLDVEGEQALWDRGYRRSDRGAAFARPVTLGDTGDVEGIATEALDILHHVLGRPGDGAPPALTLWLGDRPKTRNDTLHDRMVALSRTRDMPARQRLYGALVRAELILALERPFDGELGLGADLPLGRFGDLGGFPVHGVFTDYEHLRRHDPRVVPWRALPGDVLFPLLSARRIGSLLINPAGGVARGELYRNEIDALADWLARRGAKH